MQSPALYQSSSVVVGHLSSEFWLEGLAAERRLLEKEAEKYLHVSADVSAAATKTGAEGSQRNDQVTEGNSAINRVERERRLYDLFTIHMMHRRRLYKQYAMSLSLMADTHSFYQLMMWCHDHHIFLHPSIRIERQRTAYRDHAFFVTEDVERLTPLLAIPEDLVIGFKDANTDAISSAGADRNNLYDPKREAEFHALNSGDADVCEFFFSSLGMIVSDLITAKSSALTDPRFLFAELLGKVPTIQNAPYFEDDVVFDSTELSLADVLLQMIRNYLNGGPLVNKVPRQDLQWAVSVCLSHSTPLSIGAVRSIGIVPMVHLFPHGGTSTNAYLIARTSRSRAAERMLHFFQHQFGWDFSRHGNGRWIYVVPDRRLVAGEEIRLQAMAPVCDRDGEAEQMWRMTCGSVPSDYKNTADVFLRQQAITEEVLEKGNQPPRDPPALASPT